MTVVGAATRGRQGRHGLTRTGWLAIAAVVALVAVAFTGLAPWAGTPPAEVLPPTRAWVTQFFKWLARDLDFGIVTFRDLTRAMSWLLDWPLAWSEALLYEGFRSVPVGSLPWVAVVAGAALLGHWIGGRRLGLLAGLGFLYLAVFGFWKPSMQTLSLIVVTAPLAAALGLSLGIAAARNRRTEAVVTAAFDVMQSVPHLAYLAPVIVLFGFGQVPGLIATAIFAMPPMARCTILGLRTVPPEVIEAGRMCGCSRGQLLWRVAIPAARPTLMVGVNQVIMQSLAMVVIASLIGAVGLGYELLFSLQQLRLGKAVEQGVAIVIMAVVLDRLSQAYARRKPEHATAAEGWPKRHAHLLTFAGILVMTAASSFVVPGVGAPLKAMTVTTAPLWDAAVKWMTVNLFDALEVFRDGLTVHVLIPLRHAFQWLPWAMVVPLVGLLGLRLGGARLAVLVMAMIALIVALGFWTPALITAYYTTVAVILCSAIGIPIGVWAARNEAVARVVQAVCDTLQTFPSFIYLIPVIMLFRVGDLAIIIAILGYASVPAVRLTYLGLKRVPETLIEAATAAGCTARQRLWKVELPLAFPEIMLGLNQTIMMALAMTAITALIGSRDLGQEILKALPDADTGRGVLAGLSIALIGMTADRLIGAWSRTRKRQLGLAS